MAGVAEGGLEKEVEERVDAVPSESLELEGFSRPVAAYEVSGLL